MKKLTKDVKTLGIIGVGIGVGSAVTSRLGHGSGVFSSMGSMMGPVATGVMGMHTLRLVKKNMKR